MPLKQGVPFGLSPEGHQNDTRQTFRRFLANAERPAGGVLLGPEVSKWLRSNISRHFRGKKKQITLTERICTSTEDEKTFDIYRSQLILFGGINATQESTIPGQ